jgi:hypothetical protein
MRGGSKYIKPGDREPIEVQITDRYTRQPLVDKTNIVIQVRRINDDLYLDWDDNELKDPALATTLQVALKQVSKDYSPGLYQLDHAPDHLRGLDTSQITNAGSDDVYDITVVQAGGSDAEGLPVGYELHLRQEVTLPSEIADAVWNAMQADHTVLNSFGDLMRRIVALQKEHYVIDNMVHNTQGLLTEARIRLFENKADVLAATDGGSGEGEFATYTFVTLPDGSRPALADVVRSVRDS